MLKASASPLLHYLSGLLSFCWVIYELQTGGPAREAERREDGGRLTETEGRSEVEERGSGEIQSGEMERKANRRKGQEMRTRRIFSEKVSHVKKLQLISLDFFTTEYKIKDKIFKCNSYLNTNTYLVIGALWRFLVNKHKFCSH